MTNHPNIRKGEQYQLYTFDHTDADLRELTYTTVTALEDNDDGTDVLIMTNYGELSVDVYCLEPIDHA